MTIFEEIFIAIALYESNIMYHYLSTAIYARADVKPTHKPRDQLAKECVFKAVIYC